jgi:disulfide bond formation protein DsbB
MNDINIAEPAIPNRREVAADGDAWLCIFLAWVLASISALAVLFVGEVMGQTPCNMCWFQRAFMFPLAVILGVAAFRSDVAVWWYSLPLSGLGALFALYHSLLYVGVIPETLSPCSQGVSCASSDMLLFGFLPLPILSLASFLGIAAFIYFAKRRDAS